MGTTAVVNRCKVHGTTTTARAVPPKQAQDVPSKAYGTKVMTQAMSLQTLASHPRVPHAEQPTPVAQPAPTEQPTLVAQPAPAEQSALVAQPTPVVQLAPTEQPTPVAQPAPVAQSAPVGFQASQIGPRLVQSSRLQISGLMIKPRAFSLYFSADLTFPSSNLAPRVYHTSAAQGETFLLNSSNPNGEQHLSRQVIELISALAQQTTLVNQLLQRTKMQCVPNEVPQRRTRANKEPLQQHLDKQPLDLPQIERLGRLGPQGASSISHRSRQHDGRREAVTQSGLSSTSSLQNLSPARNPPHALLPRHRRAEHIEEQPGPAGQDWGSRELYHSQQRQIQEEVEMLLTKRLRNFPSNEAIDKAFR
ncbi:alpha/beta-gliadin clone PW8142-like [Pyrus communis]|uniref:alpha/beta-gliadin clone PW8142-like n=1 Tax=Pyrus communis TaxID=23211 RepID=UPI0035C0BF6C